MYPQRMVIILINCTKCGAEKPLETGRRRIWEALVGRKKVGSAVRDLDCSTMELKEHLEQQFRDEMSWENYGDFWSVDHIIPLSAFDLTSRKQFLKATHYTNLQPLTLAENSAKGNRLPPPSTFPTPSHNPSGIPSTEQTE